MNKTINNRFKIILILTIISFLILIIRLFDVMVIDNKKYNKKLAELSNKLIEVNTAPRGRILDRNYNIIVDNKAINNIVFKNTNKISKEDMIKMSYLIIDNISLDYNKVTEIMKKEFFLEKNPKIAKKKITNKEWNLYNNRKLNNKDLYSLKISRVTNDELNSMTENDIKASYVYNLMNNGYSYDEKVIKKDIDQKECMYIIDNADKLKGFSIKTDWKRIYPYNDTLKSILGTVSTTGIPKENKDDYLEKGYSLNDKVGISYLEKQYEEYLRGENDIYRIINSHETELIKEGSRGKDIVLTIDINLQQEVERIISEQIMRAKTEPNTEYYDHSSVIIEDPSTGEILAMASKKYVNGNIVDNITSILTSPITPGSVVKGASILVGYNTEAIKIGEYMLDECIKVAGVKEKCSSHTLGWINDITALAKSSNVYQFKTAIRVSGQNYSRNMKLNFNQKAFDLYRKMYHSFGLGVSTGIDLPVESLGYTSKDNNAGNLLDFVMGQYETYTPIQLSQYITTIANGGTRLAPHLLKEVYNSSDQNKLGEKYLEINPTVLNTIPTEEKYFNRMKEGLYAVLHSPGGYGVGYIDRDLDAAGKTGTSQSFLDTDNDGIIDTETITSSFVGYLPANNPKISIVVTSPDSSHPNSNNDFASFVTLRITKEVTNKYAEMYLK